MPELGSKISLISKADIRYEGRLFTVDPQECTIALASVRSFGTEDRETQYPILPQPTIYDYILFRGSDIKDIRVVNNVAIPNDPAIMQMHLPPNQMVPQQQQQFQQQGYGGMPGGSGGQHMGPPQQMQQFNAGPFGNMQGGNMPVPMQQGGPQQPGSNQNLAPGSGTTTTGNKQKQTNSRSGTPNNMMSRKSPTGDMGNQQQQNAGGNKDKAHMNNKQQMNQRNNNHQNDRRDSGRNDGGNIQRNDDQKFRNQNRRSNNTNNNNNNNNQKMNNQNQQRGGWQMNRGGNQMRGQTGGSVRMRGRSGVPQQNNFGYKPKPAWTLKFDKEYDFEQANSKFEELCSQLTKIKVGEEIKTPEQVNGEIEKKDDSGNETGAGDNENETDEAGYDKRKSFFDNISCEAVERSKGKTQRTDWRQELELNSVTFGIASARSGNFRGRGGYYNRGPSNYHRGGQYRGSNQYYRSIRGGHKNNRNNMGGQQRGQNMHQQQQANIQQQSQPIQQQAQAVVAVAN